MGLPGLNRGVSSLVFLLEAPGEGLFLAPRGCWHSLAQGHITLTPASVITSPSLTLVPLTSHPHHSG